MWIKFCLNIWLAMKKSVRPNILVKTPQKAPPNLKPPDVRLLFSCLTHADHGDAARASGGERQRMSSPKLRASERLLALKKYVDGLKSQNDETERNRLRSSFFSACADIWQDNSISICDAPVGTGKTTAVMARLLATAERHKLRRVFVILPFTNIISQSVSVYRRSLTLTGESSNDVVAEIHHRADFEDVESRKLTALWDARLSLQPQSHFSRRWPQLLHQPCDGYRIYLEAQSFWTKPMRCCRQNCCLWLGNGSSMLPTTGPVTGCWHQVLFVISGRWRSLGKQRFYPISFQLMKRMRYIILKLGESSTIFIQIQ